eukprot:scaffold11191_cov63-Phaeocystis_antarctica.AAC.4
MAGCATCPHLLPVGVLDSGVVLIDEVVLDELDRQGRLTDAAATYDDQLVLGHRGGVGGVLP